MPNLTSSEAFRIIAYRLEGAGNLIKDSGGLTKWGISKRAFPDEDIAAMTFERAYELFMEHYWKLVQADYLPAPLNLLVADSAFNQGPAVAATILQRALKTVAVDGKIGKQTLNAVNHMPPAEVCALFMSQRHRYYIGTRGFDRSGTGWFNRLGRLMMELTAWKMLGEE